LRKARIRQNHAGLPDRQGQEWLWAGGRERRFTGAAFARPGAPALDVVFTVCDNAASETCPVWPGQPMTSHWGIADPAAARGTDAEVALAFKDAYRMLAQRIGAFAALPIRSLDKLSLQTNLKEIGRMAGATVKESI